MPIKRSFQYDCHDGDFEKNNNNGGCLNKTRLPEHLGSSSESCRHGARLWKNRQRRSFRVPSLVAVWKSLAVGVRVRILITFLQLACVTSTQWSRRRIYRSFSESFAFSICIVLYSKNVGSREGNRKIKIRVMCVSFSQTD
jgi:hypothetical protein